MANKILVEPGQRFNQLTILSETEKFIQPSGATARAFKCVCDCGKETVVRLSHLVRDKIKSCGNCNDRKHGESKSKLYRLWNAIHWRCNPNQPESHLYYGKGITVCDEWHDYKVFSNWAKDNGYKVGLQIDRIDNSKGYNPENCRFVKPKINTNNRDVTFIVKYEGKEYPFTELVERKGLLLHEAAIRMRISRGWDIEKAVNTPIRSGKYTRKYFDVESLRIAKNGIRV